VDTKLPTLLESCNVLDLAHLCSFFESSLNAAPSTAAPHLVSSVAGDSPGAAAAAGAAATAENHAAVGHLGTDPSASSASPVREQSSSATNSPPAVVGSGGPSSAFLNSDATRPTENFDLVLSLLAAPCRRLLLEFDVDQLASVVTLFSRSRDAEHIETIVLPGVARAVKLIGHAAKTTSSLARANSANTTASLANPRESVASHSSLQSSRCMNVASLTKLLQAADSAGEHGLATWNRLADEVVHVLSVAAAASTASTASAASGAQDGALDGAVEEPSPGSSSPLSSRADAARFTRERVIALVKIFSRAKVRRVDLMRGLVDVYFQPDSEGGADSRAPSFYDTMAILQALSLLQLHSGPLVAQADVRHLKQASGNFCGWHLGVLARLPREHKDPRRSKLLADAFDAVAVATAS